MCTHGNPTLVHPLHAQGLSTIKKKKKKLIIKVQLQASILILPMSTLLHWNTQCKIVHLKEKLLGAVRLKENYVFLEL